MKFLSRGRRLTWSISRMPISRGCLRPADRALLAFLCFSDEDSSYDRDAGGVIGASCSEASRANFRDPRLARCSLIRSWRIDEVGFTSVEPASPVPGRARKRQCYRNWTGWREAIATYWSRVARESVVVSPSRRLRAEPRLYRNEQSV